MLLLPLPLPLKASNESNRIEDYFIIAPKFCVCLSWQTEREFIALVVVGSAAAAADLLLAPIHTDAPLFSASHLPINAVKWWRMKEGGKLYGRCSGVLMCNVTINHINDGRLYTDFYWCQEALPCAMKDEDLAACHCALEALHLLPPPTLLLLSINSNQLIEWPCAERERETTRGLSFCLLSLGRFYSSSSSHFFSFPFLSPLISVIDSSHCAS